MIIKDKSQLHSIESHGDNLMFNHVQDVTQSLANAQELKDFSDNGWTHSRSMRQIGHIPELVLQRLFAENPDIAKDPNKLKSWLMTDEGAAYRTVKAIDTGKSGKLVIK